MDQVDEPVTEAEVREFVHNRWVAPGIDRADTDRMQFIQRCRASGLRDLLRELEAPYMEAHTIDFERRRATWKASHMASRLREALEKRSSDAALVDDLMERASMTGASDIVTGAQVDPDAWARVLWIQRDSFDLVTEIVFKEMTADIEQNNPL